MVNNRIGSEITTSFGVAQGRNSSPDIYSFFVSDMPRCTDEIENTDFMDPFDMAQLADDTIILAEKWKSFKDKLNKTFQYSKSIYQVPNIEKTIYCNFVETPFLDPVQISENIRISSVKPNKGHKYLGMKFIPTNKLADIIKFNLNDRIGRVCKFYAWLEENDTTPIETKLLVLDNCLFNSILYGIETWGDISCIEQDLRKIELKALKAILNVKKGTCNDIVFNELKRADIISTVMDRQWAFYHRLLKLNENDALVISFLELCNNTKLMNYYKTLHGKHRINNIKDREQRILLSSTSMMCYYKQITDIKKKCIIYNSFMDDEIRLIITRWRLSNHKLQVEVGRYQTPPIPRENRICTNCRILEDEHHAIFVCPKFDAIREQFLQLVEKYSTIQSILDPASPDALAVANLIEKINHELEN